MIVFASKMPKRSFPFANSSPLQMKTHVGVLHVEKEKHMNTIYGEGRAVFMFCSTHCIHVKAPIILFNLLPARTQEILFRGASKGKSQSQNGIQDPSTLKALRKCHSCSQIRNTVTSCTFCEKRLCISCCRQCFLCAGSFCGLCSTTE